jgi:hypothetical protein
MTVKAKVKKSVNAKKGDKQNSLIFELEKGNQSHRQAMRSAGYSERSIDSGVPMKAEPVQKALNSIYTNTRELTSLTRQDVITGILHAIQLADSLEDPATMIRGYNELSRMHGFHAPERKEVMMSGKAEVSHNHTVDVAGLPTSKLLELARIKNSVDISDADYAEIETVPLTHDSRDVSTDGMD